MDEDSRRNKNGETWQEAKRRYNRTHYQKHRSRIRAAQEARKAAVERAEAVRRTQSQQNSLEALAKAREARQEKARKWHELGHIVGRMSIEAGLSQKRIFEILQGLATKREIKEWVARAKKLDTLRRQKKSSSDG